MKALNLIFRGNDKLHFTSRIEDEHFFILAEVLLDYSSMLIHLDFSYNQITHESVGMFCKVLENAHNLESLNLQYNS